MAGILAKVLHLMSPRSPRHAESMADQQVKREARRELADVMARVKTLRAEVQVNEARRLRHEQERRQ